MTDLWHLVDREYININVKEIWNPLLLILYESVPNKKYREIQIRENFFPRKCLTTRCFVILVDPQEQNKS